MGNSSFFEPFCHQNSCQVSRGVSKLTKWTKKPHLKETQFQDFSTLNPKAYMTDEKGVHKIGKCHEKFDRVEMDPWKSYFFHRIVLLSSGRTGKVKAVF